MSLPSEISGKPVNSESDTCLSVSSLKYGEQTATSLMGLTVVSISGAVCTVGVVTTAISAEPSLSAPMA